MCAGGQAVANAADAANACSAGVPCHVLVLRLPAVLLGEGEGQRAWLQELPAVRKGLLHVQAL